MISGWWATGAVLVLFPYSRLSWFYFEIIFYGNVFLSVADLTAARSWREAELLESGEVDRSAWKASMASAWNKWRMCFTGLQPWQDPPTEPPRMDTHGQAFPRSASRRGICPSPGNCLWRRCWSLTSSPSTRSRHGRCATSAAAGSGCPARRRQDSARWRVRPPSSCTETEPCHCGRATATVGPTGSWRARPAALRGPA